MNVLLTIAKKEYRDTVRNSLFLVLASFLLVLAGISILIASLDFAAQVAAYNAALSQFSAAQLAGVVLTAPRYHPLQMLRGTMEYLEIIGAVIAIVLGYFSIAKEKGTNTARLLLTRPVSRASFVAGKALGNSLILLSLIAVLYVFIGIGVTFIGHVAFSGAEIAKLTVAMACTYLYLTFFYCFAAALALFVPDLPRALMLAFALWLVFVLIIPQVGDTMDPDNQVPGGFFAHMHVSQDQQAQIIGRFRRYENLRNALEVSSIEKHYERLTFALLGIKLTYSGKPLGFILSDRSVNWAVLVAFYLGGLGLLYAAADTRRLMASSP